VAKVKVGKRTYTATVRVKVAAGKSTTLKLRFGTRAAKAIKQALRHGKLKATVVLTAGDATATRTVTLRR
jgi:hypothetical protein